MDKEIKQYKKCYDSCLSCSKGGNDEEHNCLKCKNEFPFMLEKNGTYNCYEFCHYNNYDENNKTYQCLKEPICTWDKDKLIPDKNQCIDSYSNDDIYKYEFGKICFKECPKEVSESSQNNKYFCDLKCPSEKPFENIRNQQCIQKCDLTEKFDNKCKSNYINKTQVIDLSKQIIENIKNGSMSDIIAKIKNNNESFVLYEGNDAHLISSLGGNLKRTNFSSIDFGDCEKKNKK